MPESPSSSPSHDPRLAVELAGLRLANPVLAASGTYGSGTEVLGTVALDRFGGVVTKTVTTDPRRGNRPPRIHETAAGMLNAIGLMNPGVDAFFERVMPQFRELPCARIINVAGRTAADFATLVARFGGEDAVQGIELNVSCPNVSGGLDFGTDPGAMADVVRACRAETKKPLIVKLTPNVTDPAPLARAAAEAGADALSLVNTYLGMAVDWRRRRPELGSPTGMGGLSGPAIKPLALAMVHRVRQAVDLPLIGIGGIRSAEDVMEFLVAGATAVQVGTANFADPSAIASIVTELSACLDEVGVATIAEMVGSLRPREEGA